MFINNIIKQLFYDCILCTPLSVLFFQCVQMAHALRRISYATCEPQHAQFSFLAREPRAHFSIQYCHSFITESAEQVSAFYFLAFQANSKPYAHVRGYFCELFYARGIRILFKWFKPRCFHWFRFGINEEKDFKQFIWEKQLLSLNFTIDGGIQQRNWFWQYGRVAKYSEKLWNYRIYKNYFK